MAEILIKTGPKEQDLEIPKQLPSKEQDFEIPKQLPSIAFTDSLIDL